MSQRLHVVFVANLLFLSGILSHATAEPASVGTTGLDSAAADPARVLVVVNGEKITQGNLTFLMISRRVPAERQTMLRQRFLEQLIDRRLMRMFLADRKTDANSLELDLQMDRIQKLIRKSGDDPQQVLARLGYTEATLRRELSLPLSWKTYVSRVVTNKRLREYFRQHRLEFDGTELRASQILLKIPSGAKDEQVKAARDRLAGIREEIVDDKTTFAEAAQKFSQAPSAARGGDVGFFAYRGKMPESFTRVAFGLKRGEISRPAVTPFGVHLVTVTDRKRGDLSLEDVRLVVFNQISQEIWKELVRQQRAKAKIKWTMETK